MSGDETETSWKVLNRSRIKFGIGNLLYNGDEAAFSPFHTAIIRELGGGDRHLGFIGGAMQSMGPLFTWIGAVLLRWTKFNRKAMMLSLAAGALIQALVVVLLVMASRNTGWAGWVLYAYAGLMGLLCLNTVVSVFLFWTVPDRRSKAVKFITTHKEERVDYRCRPLWQLIWFECAWRGGRVAMMAFVTAYLMDQFGLQMSRIILIHMIVNVINIFMLYVVGRVSDRVGHRRPLMWISAVCGSSMLLWVSTAWWGLWPVFAYQFLNGAAGTTHWMLVRNLSLEVYPARGRPNFLSFSQTLVGLFLMGSTTFAGHVMAGMRGWSVLLLGAEFNHYHAFFLACTAVTMTCLLPLWLLGRHMDSPHYIHVNEDEDSPRT